MKEMQLQLFSDLPLPPRPSQYCDEVTHLTVDKVLKPILNWMYQGNYSPPQGELNDVKEDIFTAIQWDDDAYKIAKNLESAGWDSDGELVDLLDDVARHRYEAHEDLVHREWILKHGVEPKFSVGDKISFKYKGGFDVGEVTKIHHSNAKYVIFCEHHGHIRTGPGTHGHVIPFEDCLPVEVNP